MRIEPPANLIQLLERLRLATSDQVATAGRRARYLAGDLPDFESVWVDTLAQQRILTPFQAAEINAGRGPGLLQGPYRIQSRLPGPHFAECFAAEHVDDRRAVRLYAVRGSQRNLAVVGTELQLLVARGAALTSAGALRDFGIQGLAAWASCAPLSGTTAADWLVQNGRLAPQAVMQIARDMVAQLAELESYGIVHGDLGPATLLLLPSGEIAIPAPGLRPIVRPQEGYGACELRPEAYDYVAPERIVAGIPPSVATDVYACGCLWWHLLAGRAPFAGGNSLAKLKSIQAGRVVDVRPFAPTAPEGLLHALQLCLNGDPTQRPQSFAHLQELLGEATTAGRALVANLLRASDSPRYRQHRAPRRRTSSMKRGVAVGTAVTAMLCGLAMTPYLLRKQDQAPAVVTSHVQRPIAAKVENINTASEAKVVPRVDTQVRPAAANLPVVEQVVEDLVLPAGEILRVEHLDLKPHIRVRGRGGSRPRISVPRSGLLIGYDDVTFESVDFVGDATASGSGGDGAPAMLHLQAPTATFRGCSFSSVAGNAPVAIRIASAHESLPGLGGELAFTNCVFDGVSAVLEAATSSSLAVRLNHCLCVAAGPMLRLPRPPGPEARLSLALDHVTTRGDSSVLECHYGRRASQCGAISIVASNSALAGGGRGGLIQFVGGERPDQLVTALTWAGQGAIALPNTPLVVWRNPENRGAGSQRQALPEEGLDVAGLVRGELEFAGRPDGPPAASRVTRWQVPLRSPDPPGADPSLLSSPRGNARP
jgi:hypothetical protein